MSMRRLGMLIAYWVTGCAAVLALFGLGFNQARMLLPLGRALLLDGRGPGREWKNGRRWAEAALLTLAWGGVPWVVDLVVGRRLMDAGVRLFWAPGMEAGGTAVWWWLGVAIYFGLLHRRLLAALIGGAAAMLWQWAFLGPMAHEWLRPLIPSDVVIGYLVYGLVLGLTLGLADYLAGWKKSAPKLG